MAEPDIAVVGAGGVGLAFARALSAAGPSAQAYCSQ